MNWDKTYLSHDNKKQQRFSTWKGMLTRMNKYQGAVILALLISGAWFLYRYCFGVQVLTFFVVGDWGVISEGRDSVFKSMKKLRPEIRSKFVISTGDQFYKHGLVSRHHKRFQSEFEDYVGSSLGPWFLVLGNHDARGSHIAQIEYTKLSKTWQMPARFYRVEEKINGFIIVFLFLDTNSLLCGVPLEVSLTPLEEFECSEAFYQGREKWFVKRSEHLQWLKSELKTAQKRSEVKAIIVTGHHPLWSTGPHGDPSRFREALLPIFAENPKVKLYLCGHNHALESYTATTSSGHTFREVLSGAGGYNLHKLMKREPFKDSAFETVSQDYVNSTYGFVTISAKRNLEVNFWVGSEKKHSYDVIL